MITAIPQPSRLSTKNSVMSDSNYLSLTDDDREGIVALFRRFPNSGTGNSLGPALKPMARNP